MSNNTSFDDSLDSVDLFPFVFKRKKVLLNNNNTDENLGNLALFLTVAPTALPAGFRSSISLEDRRLNRKQSFYQNSFEEFYNSNQLLEDLPIAPELRYLPINVSIGIGQITKVATILITTGVGRVTSFSMRCPPGAHKFTTWQKGATALAGNIEFTPDGGATWQVLQAFDFAANKTIAFDGTVGLTYRFNVSTLTTFPADIFATLT